MSFFAVTLTGSFKERNEFECLINRLLSLVKPPAFNQPNLFATTQWGQKKLICTADWTSFNLGKSSPHHHPPHNTTAGQRTKFFILSGKCCQVLRLRISPSTIVVPPVITLLLQFECALFISGPRQCQTFQREKNLL